MGALSDTDVLVIERACERLINELFDAIDSRTEPRPHDLFTEHATYARPPAGWRFESRRGRVLQHTA